MKRHSISELQMELDELKQKFEQNMKLINILYKYSSDKVHFNEKFPPILTQSEATLERLRLIDENFEINNRRIDIIKTLKNVEFQSNRDLEISLECESEQKLESNKFDFLADWKDYYTKQKDFLMIEILEILNN